MGVSMKSLRLRIFFCCAAGLICGKLNRTPACIIRGFPYQSADSRARHLLRPSANDLFR